MWIIYVISILFLFAYFIRVCLLMSCGHLLGKGWPLGSRLWCIIVKLSPGSGVVLDCIDSWSLPSFFLPHGALDCTLICDCVVSSYDLVCGLVCSLDWKIRVDVRKQIVWRCLCKSERLVFYTYLNSKKIPMLRGVPNRIFEMEWNLTLCFRMCSQSGPFPLLDGRHEPVSPDT